jgi:arabinogalactan endo-1,4-beta-galactosidase
LTDIIFEHLKEYRINYDVITSSKLYFWYIDFSEVITS